MVASAPAARERRAFSSVETVVNTARPAALGDLGQQKPDAARAGVHEAGLARRERVRARREVVRGHSLEHRGRALLRREAVGQPDQACRRNGRLLRVRAEGGGPRDAIADAHLADVGRDGDDRPRALLPERHRHRGLVEAGPVIHVDEVDARGLDTDDGLAGLRLRIRHVLDAQRLGSARRVDANGLHDFESAAAFCSAAGASGGASGKELTFFFTGFSVFR